MRFRKQRGGFTLLELIIVIIVIGILASIALPRYIRIAEKGRTSEAKSLLSTLRSAQLRYAAQFSVYTNNISFLDVPISTQKYFNCTAVAGSTNLADNAASLATCTRLTTAAAENPNVGAYVINITMDGSLGGDTTGRSFI